MLKKSLLIIGSLCACSLAFTNDIAQSAAAEEYQQFEEFKSDLRDMHEQGIVEGQNELIIPVWADMIYYINSGIDLNDPDLNVKLRQDQGLVRIKGGARVVVIGFYEGPEGKVHAIIKQPDSHDPEALHFLYAFGG